MNFKELKITLLEQKAKITEQEIKIQQLEQLLLRSCSFIVDASGSWDTYAGHMLLDDICKLNIRKNS